MRYSEYTVPVTYFTKILSRRTCVFTNENQLNVKILYDTTQIHIIIIFLKVNHNHALF